MDLQLFLNISGGEILVILVVVYLIFGPKKIPELARMVGKGINELRRATNEIKREINLEATVMDTKSKPGTRDRKKGTPPAPESEEQKGETKSDKPKSQESTEEQNQT